MAAIPMEFAVLGLGAVGTIVIPAAAAGIAAVVTRFKMKPESFKVTDINELRAGDHISYKLSTFSTLHAIVVEQSTNGHAKLAYVTGKYAEADVNCESVDLSPYLVAGSLQRHEFNRLMCFAGDEIAERAKTLTIEYNPAERHAAIHSFWRFFRDDEHFAVWAQTGMHFAAVMRGMMSSDYKHTVVRNVSSLREGDHVCHRVGFGPGGYEHGIVVKINVDEKMIGVVGFSGMVNEAPRLTNVGVEAYIRKGLLYRYDYDLAIGDEADLVVSRATSEVGKLQSHASGNYKTDEQFCVWCKTTILCSPNDASTLTTARTLGQVCVAVQSRRVLKVGDHVAYNSGRIYYYQHAVIVGISDTKIDVVFLPGNVDVTEKLCITMETIDVTEYIRKKQLYKYFYDVAEWKSPKMVVARAEEQIGAPILERPFKDPLHFAVWCKVGEYQLNRRAIALELDD